MASDLEETLKEFEKIKFKLPWTGTSYFNSDEHAYIGNLVPRLSAGPLKLPNGLELSLGQIIALAGDFYGVPNSPIVDASEESGDKVKTSKRERTRFEAAFNTLAKLDIRKELDEILKVMKEEKEAIESAKARGEEPGIAYEKLGDSLNEKYDTATDGTWVCGKPVIFGRMLNLAQQNFDHFFPNAKKAYLAGHELALEKAKEAGKNRRHEMKEKLLDEAYAIDAFACHFLTDSFSSGHIRTPRLELAKHVTPSLVGYYLSLLMHNEDNKYGLHVTNNKGQKWIAYGDGMLLNDECKDNFRFVVKAVKASVGQVYDAFNNPSKKIEPNDVTDQIPFVDATVTNNYPLFQMKDGKLVCRNNLNDLSDPTTTSNWIGVTTAWQLISYTPQNSINEAKPHSCRTCIMYRT